MNGSDTKLLADAGGLAAAILARPREYAISYQEAIDYAIEVERVQCTARFDETIKEHWRSGRLRDAPSKRPGPPLN